MARDIFRKDVLDRMASPDRLDRPVRLVRPAHWLFLACLVALLAFALLWSLVADLPIKVGTRGILVDPLGLDEITVAHDGRLEELAVGVGDVVAAGDKVAMLASEVRQRDVELARAELENTRASAERAERVHRAAEERLGVADERRLDSLARRATDLQSQLASREAMTSELRRLIKERIATPDELLDAVATVDALRAELLALEQESLDVELAAERRTREREREALDFEQRIGILEQELLRLEAQVGDETTIVAPRGGVVAELKVDTGDVVQEGQAIALVDRASDGRRLEAIIYMGPGDGKRVRPGMRAEIMPTTTEREIYGHIIGTVSSVTAVPATPAGMRRQLRNDALVAELSAAGAPLEIRVDLAADATTPSGLAWSSSRGPDLPVSEGTMVEGSIVVERRRVIDLILPGLARRWREASSDGSAPT